MPYVDKRVRTEYHKSIRARNKKYIHEYLKIHPCTICGFDDTRALDFDHKDPDTKLNTLANMVTGTHSLKRIEEEILKCDVLCANCHRIKTFEQFGYSK